MAGRSSGRLFSVRFGMVVAAALVWLLFTVVGEAVPDRLPWGLRWAVTGVGVLAWVVLTYLRRVERRRRAVEDRPSGFGDPELRVLIADVARGQHRVRAVLEKREAG